MIGSAGEKIVENYLKNNGYKILEKNLKTRYLEIDIIAEKNNTLIFIEVRSKTNDNFGEPEDTINKKKKEKLKNNAFSYINYKNYDGLYKIEIVSVILDKNNINKKESLRHYKDIIFE